LNFTLINLLTEASLNNFNINMVKLLFRLIIYNKKKKNMKNQILKLTFILGIGLLSSFGAKAQWIRERPREHTEIEVRPARPSPRHYWRDGEWEWRGGAYVWAPGLWIESPRGGVWVRGHWRNGRGGYRWVPGHWR